MKLVSIWIGKILTLLLKIFNRSSATALPGLIATTITPELIAHFGPQFKKGVILVSGTNGKTTTTTLLGSMISHSGKPFALAGNLGISLSREAELVPSDGLIAAEVSSFQLEECKAFAPDLALMMV